MLTRLGTLAEAETDEATLQQTLELHSALEQAMGQYETLLAVAEVLAPFDMYNSVQKVCGSHAEREVHIV
jgi:hypothetical protein